MTIYSRSGDAGQTDLFPFGRISKTDPKIETLGELDELNASLGVLRALIQENEKNFPNQNGSVSEFSDGLTLDALIESFQKIIFRLSSEISSSSNPETPSFSTIQYVASAEVENLEKNIDALETSLPPLRRMICVQGPSTAAFAQLARAVCRRAERSVWRLEEYRPASVSPYVCQWLNRFSDFLFLLGRKLAFNHENSQADR